MNFLEAGKVAMDNETVAIRAAGWKIGHLGRVLVWVNNPYDGKERGFRYMLFNEQSLMAATYLLPLIGAPAELLQDILLDDWKIIHIPREQLLWPPKK